MNLRMMTRSAHTWPGVNGRGQAVLKSGAPASDAVGVEWSRLLRRATLVVLLVLVSAYVLTFSRHGREPSVVGDEVLGNAALILPSLVCLGRAALVRTRRAAYLLLGLSIGVYALGNLVYTFHDARLDPVPSPALSDIGYLTSFPLLIAALVLFARPDLRGLSLSRFLDGLLGALSCAAAVSVLTVRPALSDDSGPVVTRAVVAAYPVFGVTLVAMVVAVLTMRGGRPGATWLCLLLGIVLRATADTVYLHRLLDGSFSFGTPLDALWALAMMTMACAALSIDPPAARRTGRESSPAFPNVFTVAAVALLIYGSTVQRLPLYATALVVAALATAVKRTAVGVAALRQLSLHQHQAQTDELTQLANRRYFDEQVQQALLDRPPTAPVAIVMVDLNGFKAVNDTFGHHAGDEILRQVASRLKAVLRSDDVLARLGGDEFGLLLTDCRREEALAIGDRMVDEVSQPMVVEGQPHVVGASVGIALCPDDGTEMATLLQRADLAMFDAKANRHGPTLYDARRHREHTQRLNVRDAVDRHQLTLYYQPQYDLRSGRMSGVEALVRWDHPSRGLLHPDTFLPSFEQAGMMGDLTLEVLRIAVEDRENWVREYGLDLDLAVNLSPTALVHSELVAAVVSVLARYRVPPEVLTLEITEHAMMIDTERSRRALLDLRAHGIKLSLDDYGTGYSSLTYLYELPLNEIKIDQSFVRAMTPGSPGAAIVASSIELARTLGLHTVAEGVETPVALELLSTLGCDTVQGFLLGKPVTAVGIPRLPEPDWGRARRLVSH
jgi:diguanylate cyclase